MAAFYNQATLSYNNTVVNSNTVTGEMIETLSITKTALDPTYTQGDILAYAVSIVNTGEADYTGLTLTDNLGAYEYNTDTLIPLEYVDGSVHCFVNGVLQDQPSATAAGDTIVFSDLTVPAQGSAVIIYEAAVTGFAPLGTGQSITNTAELAGAGIADTLASSAVSQASQDPELTVSKSVSPSEVAKSGTLTYSFLIGNNGASPALADDNVSLSDVFDPVLNNISVTLNGAAFDRANYTYDEDTGSFATVPGTITVPAAVYSQNPATGEWVSQPGTAVLVISGTV